MYVHILPGLYPSLAEPPRRRSSGTPAGRATAAAPRRPRGRASYRIWVGIQVSVWLVFGSLYCLRVTVGIRGRVTLITALTITLDLRLP